MEAKKSVDTRKRGQILENKKKVAEIIKAAISDKDPLSSFPTFQHYCTNDLDVRLEWRRGDHLSSSVKKILRSLLKVNMEEAFGMEWPEEEKVKRREMVSPDARYILVYAVDPNIWINVSEKDSISVDDRGQLVAFVHYRFTVEEEIPVLYVYELQLERHVQGKGLGKFLMSLIEMIACKSNMGAVVLTVQKSNMNAMNFYRSKLRYSVSSMSPSQIGLQSTYEILCKTFDQEAKAALEVW